ncbi:hypothetical protein CAEBREN_09319 [Caenorhabditis brenneri]|uniref:Uncharacterized protein n=1 Tax=Caenorhabditis brenneri TaxID=135651 RepID=G0PA86_CAEBE|nr:hypothetical protein CAEBREN_09319 [Caenorhabditis brenneri]
MYSTSNSGTTDVSSIDPVTPTPDSLFPEAIYIPAGTKSSEITMLIGSSVSSRESVRAVKTTGHGCHMQKLAVEPLEDIRQLKCRGLPKSKPDSLFPKATYESGPEKILAISPVTSSIVTTDKSCNLTTTTTTNSCNLDVQPIEFFSADGRIKMMLQPVAETNKRKQAKAAPATEEYTVPKQLQSSTRLKTIENPRAKFSTNFTIFDNSIDLSGIFNGNSMKKRDLSKLVINGKSFFPEAKINAKSTSLMYSTSNTGTTDVSSIDPVTPTPDSLFPEAIYIPAGTKSSEIKMLIGSSVSSRESVRAVKTTGHGCHMQKLAVEPLEDIRQLKCRGLPKSKPDSLFPKATYESGPEKILAISPVTSSIVTTDKSCNLTTSTINSCNLDVQPIEFFSADGRIKMMLQPVAEKTKRKQPKAAAATEEYTVPKQLQSSTRLKTIENPRAKFSTNFTIFDNSIDLSGIFNGNSMKKRDLSKLVINGKSYST